MSRRQELLMNAITNDYIEAYEKTQPYNVLRDLYEIDFESYITAVSQVLEMYANKRPRPYVASPEQARVIYSLAKRIGIVASPGSGKTTTILYKLYINRVIMNWSEGDILAITYTADAAEGMRDGYKNLVKDQPGAQLVDFKTIHKFGKEFIEIANPRIQLITEDKPLIEYYYDYELEENMQVETTMHELIRKAVKQNGLEQEGLTTKKIISALSVVSEKMITDNDTFKDCEQFMDFPISFDELMLIKQTYSADKNSKACMDYVDMLEAIHAILSTIDSLEQIQDIRLRNHLTYKAIYLDEAQDVSPLQISIINHLLRLNADCQLAVVGDDDQSIFDFRGANPDYLVNLQNFYPKEPDGSEPLEIIYMTYNRRSAPLIVRTMNKVIAHNVNRYDKEGKAFNTDLEGNINIIQDMKYSVCKSIIITKAKELFGKTGSARNMAVLYREHAQVKPIVNAFVQERIPFNIGEDLNQDLFVHNHFVVKDILGIMQMLLDLNSPYNIKDYLYKLCPYMGEKAAKSISSELAIENSKPLSERKKLSKIIAEHGKGQSNKVILECLELVKDSDNQTDNYTLIDTIYNYYKKAYLDWYLKTNKDKVDGCDEALMYLLSKNVIGYQALKNSVLEDRNWTNSHYKYTLGVKLRTFHTSKGLEWEHVYLLPISNNVCPKSSVLAKLSAQGSAKYIEEERRLFYVACTRAISNLTVFYSQDSPEDTNMFIEEIKIALHEVRQEMENEKNIEMKQAQALLSQEEVEGSQDTEIKPEHILADEETGNIPMPEYTV